MASSSAAARNSASTSSVGLGLAREPADHVAADAGPGASRADRVDNPRNESGSPKRRIRRSTLGAACWKDRSKYGTTLACRAIASIRLGRISAGCR